MVSREAGRGGMGSDADGDEVSFWGAEEVLELDHGDACTMQ